MARPLTIPEQHKEVCEVIGVTQYCYTRLTDLELEELHDALKHIHYIRETGTDEEVRNQEIEAVINGRIDPLITQTGKK